MADKIEQKLRRVASRLSLKDAPEIPQQQSSDGGQIGQAGIDVAMVLDEVTPTRMEPICWTSRGFPILGPDARTVALQVHDATVGQMPTFPPRMVSTQAEVCLFEVEKIGFVKQPDLLGNTAKTALPIK